MTQAGGADCGRWQMSTTAGPALHMSWDRGTAESRPQEHTVLLPWKDPLENNRIMRVGFQPGLDC